MLLGWQTATRRQKAVRTVKRDPWKTRLLVLLCATCLAACTPAYAYRMPEPLDDGWQVASLEDVGLDKELLCEMVDRARDGTYENVHSILIVVDGKLVLEEYFVGHKWIYDRDRYQGERTQFGVDTIHNLASVTKAVTSALVGIAIDQGYIEGVEARVFDFFPEYVHLRDEVKAQITLRHLLTMASGLQWNEGAYGYDDDRNDLIRLFREPDPVAYILSRPAIHEPGSTYYYSGGDVNLLGGIIKRATGQRMDAFAQRVLFDPLGITHYKWDMISRDVVHASGNLQLRPRDVAKFGALYWNGGAWRDGQRVISKAWIEESTQGYIAIPGSHGDRYGYQWRLRTYQVGGSSVQGFSKAGWGGQWVMVFPDQDMVVVFTGGNYTTRDPADEIATRYILPAVR
jgi:CubicO group peptidase (beta-lactamase class C family)